MQDLLLFDVTPLPMVDVYYDIDANSILGTSALDRHYQRRDRLPQTEFDHKMHMTEESRLKAVQQGQD